MKKIKKIFNIMIKKSKKIIIEGIKQVKLYFKDRLNLAIALLVILVVILGIMIIGFVKTFLLALFIVIIILGIKKGGFLLMKKNKKNTTQKETKKGKKRKLVTNIIVIIILIASILFILLGIAFMGYIIVSAPKFNTKNLLYKEASIVYDKNGIELLRLGNELRENITYDQLPQVFIDAIVATEDSRFFEHNGFDLPRFMKASAGQALGNSGAGGASTITMQVIKNNFTSANQTIIRKFTDIYLSVFKLEKAYTKEQILEFYVNNIHLGVNNTLGVAETSRQLFGKDISDINLAESALLAGMFQAPGAYNPYKYPEAADKRRKTVLYLMQKHGYINSDEYNIASSVKISNLVIPQTSKADKYQGYIDYAVAEAEEKTGFDPMEVSMKIYTNLDITKQDYINSIINGTNWNWENDTVQAGIAVTDVNSGAILALGTSRKTGQKLYSFATDIKRQIGSTAKPLFDYGPGMEYNNFSTYTPFVDDAYSYTGGKSISDWDGKYQGLQTARLALSGSRNIPALKAFQQLDRKKIIAFVQSLGITPEIENGSIHEAHAIGGFNGVSPLQMAAAYAAFSNGGYYYKPYAVNKIEIVETAKIATYSSEKVRVMSDSTAYMITNILKGGVDSGLIGGGKVSGVEVAAKSGTTNFDEATEKANHLGSNAINDLWYVGYSPDYSIGMWYGYEKISSLHYSKMNITSSIRNKLFTAIAKGIFEKNGKTFAMPSSVVSSRVETGTIPAMLPSSNTPSNLIITELFKKGAEPTEVSPRFNTLPAVTNLTAVPIANTIKLSWTGVTKPNMITPEYLATISAQTDKYLGIYQNQDNNLLGTLGYNVYIKKEDGTLKKIDWTSSLSYVYNPTLSGDLVFVVKACYSNFNSSESAPSTVSAVNPLSGISVEWPTTSTVNIIQGTPFNIHSGISVMDGTTDVTEIAITQTINNVASSILNTSIKGTYIVKYTASYKSLNETYTRTIKVN